nr:p12-like protein [Green Sichuan pepper idaeovirus]
MKFEGIEGLLGLFKSLVNLHYAILGLNLIMMVLTIYLIFQNYKIRKGQSLLDLKSNLETELLKTKFMNETLSRRHCFLPSSVG